MFIDHAKGHYLPDLRRILERGWLHPGSVVVADNIKVPGAPAYHAYLREREGRGWRTVEHDTHVEYQPKTPRSGPGIDLPRWPRDRLESRRRWAGDGIAARPWRHLVAHLEVHQ